MDDLTQVEAQIRERLTASQARRHRKQEFVSREMAERARRTDRFKSVAKRLLNKVILPRLQMLEGVFPHARLTTGGSPNTRLCKCTFDHTPEFPASTTLEISLSSDDDIGCVIVGYKLEIFPVFFEFERSDQTVIPLDEMHEAPVATWLDSKLLQFTDTYLKVQDVRQYQEENMTVDPVCGMRINTNHAAASVKHEGQTYYFCVAECREKFLDDPDRYTSGNHARAHIP